MKDKVILSIINIKQNIWREIMIQFINNAYISK